MKHLYVSINARQIVRCTLIIFEPCFEIHIMWNLIIINFSSLGRNKSSPSLLHDKKQTNKKTREIFITCYSISTVAMKLLQNSVPSIFKYLMQHCIICWAKLISGAILLKFWSMSQAKHISKCLNSGGDTGSSMGLFSCCKLNMCLLVRIGP